MPEISRKMNFNELVESMTCLNALEGKSEKSWKIEKSSQNIVMNEELVKKSVMNEEFVRNSVMNAKIVVKVVLELFKFKIFGWNILQLRDHNLLEEFTDENEPWLLIGIPDRGPFVATQYLMQCCMLQHSADRYWLHDNPGGHASWREPTMKKFTKESSTYFVKLPVCRLNVQRMQSESSEYIRKTTGFFTNSWRIKIAWRATLKSMHRMFGREVG